MQDTLTPHPQHLTKALPHFLGHVNGMGISQYPRRGCSIAPQALRDLLDKPIPSHLLGKSSPYKRLFELDAGVWDHVTPSTCRELSQEVLREVKVSVFSDQNILSQVLPLPLETTKVGDLELERRTYNCLLSRMRRFPVEHRTLLVRDMLSGLTIRDALQLRGFGIKSLVDLLVSLEALNSHPMKTEERDVFVEPTPISGTLLAEEVKVFHQIDGLDRITLRDPRLGSFVLEIDPTAKNLREAIDSLVHRTFEPRRLENLRDGLRSLRDSIESLSKQTVEEELLQLAHNGRGKDDQRNAQMLARYLGWDGEGGCTLDNVGLEFGLTRERVRQIVTPRIVRLKGRKPYTPVLDEVLALVEGSLPITAYNVEQRIRAAGLSSKAFAFSGLLNAAGMLGKNPNFTVVEVDGSRILVAPSTENVAKLVIHNSEKSVRHWGVCNIDEVRALVDGQSTPSDPAFVPTILEAQNGFRWLDDSKSWFWLNSFTSSRLFNRIDKVLSVCPQIEVPDLRGGIQRSYEMGGFAPPSRVILELCRQAPQYTVENNIVSSLRELDWHGVLNPSEKIMVQILRELGTVVLKDEFEVLCMDQGLSRPSFYRQLTYSPIIARFASCIYGLRGVEVPAGEIEDLVPRTRGTVLKDYGWTKDGKIWLSYEVSVAMLANGLFYVPAAMVTFLDGEYKLKLEDDLYIGTLVAKGTTSWGLGPFFTRRGGEPGDYLMLLFDLTNHEASVRVGDVGLIENVQDDEGLHGDLR